MNSVRCHKQNDSPNRNDLSSFLKVVNDVEVERRAGGKLFHARGPATIRGMSLFGILPELRMMEVVVTT